MRHTLPLAAALFGACPLLSAQQDDDAKPERFSAATFRGLELRDLGPALTSGRVVDFAVHPRDRSVYWVAAASGGVWKTVNAGTTWQPLFDAEESYSIGCIALDPNRPDTVWVGTGENNSQRSVSYGDGVYKSLDGGKSWKNVGLKDSQHIARIAVDPRDSDTVYVAAQGPLWSAGGDRGLYKTMDGGSTWTAVLQISEHTGVTDLLMDPRDPDVLYAASYQRRRHVFTLINGGPEAAIHKSTDGGRSWRKLKKGLPGGDVGRIGLALAPSRPDTVYAIVEARKGGGFYRSTDAGESWQKRSDYVSGSPQYYQEIVVDPVDPDRIYSNDVLLRVSADGGETFVAVGEDNKHVDNHAIWIDPAHTDYLLVGCDGGVYESFDRGGTWHFKANLPITQFYRITADEDFPFYNVYGGTQDNFSLGGPSRTTSRNGITNGDWYVTAGGDGFETVVDPEDPDTVYSESQHGGLVRFDRRTGERTPIKPQAGPDDAPLKWNWNAPLLISPHRHTRLYFAADRLFRSDDRGDSWRAVSADLSAGLDRNALPVMGRTWSVDAVSKNRSTSVYGNIVALDESPLEAGRIWLGTDDGLIHTAVVDDDPHSTPSWTRLADLPGIPAATYVSALEASRHDPAIVYAAFDDHKRGNFAPYLLKSTDAGRSWTSIAGDLPQRGSVHTVVEDHVDPDLLFAGTEFGLYFTVDGGARWLELTGNMPTIAVRDLEIQKRENDLVVGTFGRGIRILDDYSALRDIDPATLDAAARLFPVRRAWLYLESTPLGRGGKGFMGDSFYAAPNPPVGAVFTYYLRESLKTKKEQRHAAEASLRKQDQPIPYPSWDELRAEDREQKPELVLTVRDAAGDVVRRLSGSTSRGMHRTTWDLRYPSSSGRGSGPLVLPGRYRVELETLIDGRLEQCAGPVELEVEVLPGVALPALDLRAALAFHHDAAELQRAVTGASRAAGEARERIDAMRQAILDTSAADPSWLAELRAIEQRLSDLLVDLEGDRTLASRYAATAPSIRDRARSAASSWGSTSAPTGTQRRDYEIAAQGFETVLAELRQLCEKDLAAMDEKLEGAGAPWTPGRLPQWRRR